MKPRKCNYSPPPANMLQHLGKKKEDKQMEMKKPTLNILRIKQATAFIARVKYETSLSSILIFSFSSFLFIFFPRTHCLRSRWTVRHYPSLIPRASPRRWARLSFRRQCPASHFFLLPLKDSMLLRFYFFFLLDYLILCSRNDTLLHFFEKNFHLLIVRKLRFIEICIVIFDS